MEHYKEYYTKAVKYGNEIPVTKTSFFYLAANLYRLSLVCEILGEHDEALKHLDEAKHIAKVGGSYRNWMLLVVLLKLKNKYKEMGSLDRSDEYLREAKCVADATAIIEPLKEAGKDLSKEVPPLLKLGEWYLDKAKTTINASDFTKANALFNAALVRSRYARHEIDEDQILRRIIETYREFLLAFTNEGDGMSVDEIRNEIDSHKEWLGEKRKILKEKVNEIDQNRKTEEKDEIHAEKMHEVFRDIQDMYVRLVSMLVKECEGMLGRPPCKYAIIALGSVARMEATPFSDLEFAILHEDGIIEDKINYFRLLSYFLHLKVINLGETILPALAIQELNDFQSPDPNDCWFYDSFTPRGISFDGAMPWASKTALGRVATKDKPALELIRTPEHMAELQDEETAIKEGYHLANIMSRVTMLYGEQALLDEYKNRVTEKLNTKPPEGMRESVGFTRGIQQLIEDIVTYDPSEFNFGLPIGGLFDTKKHFYRLISLLLTDLGLLFDIIPPSPWQVILELRNRNIISESDSAELKLCLSIANEIRLKTYFANRGQKEQFSPLQSADITEHSTDDPIFRDFDEDTLVRLLSTSYDMHRRCHAFCLKYRQQDEVDASILQKPFSHSKVWLKSNLYLRLQNFPKSLECIKSLSKDFPDYARCLHIRAKHHELKREWKEAIECFETGLEYSQEPSDKLFLYRDLAKSLIRCFQIKKAKRMVEEAMQLHDEVYGEGSETSVLSLLMLDLGIIFYLFKDYQSAIQTYQRVEQMQKRIRKISDIEVLNLNIHMSFTYSRLRLWSDLSLEYMERALRLSHKLFGEHNVSFELLKIYQNAVVVYINCRRYDKALPMVERSFKLMESLHGDTPHPDKIDCLTELGNLYLRKHEVDKARKSFESALEIAKKGYPGQPRVARVLNDIGKAAHQGKMLDQSLRYFQEAKEILDNHIEVKYSTSTVLNSNETGYEDLGKLLSAFLSYKDAVDIAIRSGELDNIVCKGMANTVMQLSVASVSQTRMFSRSKEHKAIENHGEKCMSLCKVTCPMHVFVDNLYQLSLICKVDDEQDEVLKILEEARDMAKNFDYKGGRVVLVLLLLSSSCGQSGFFEKLRSYYEEAKEMAKSLPPEDDSILPGELGIIASMKKE